MRLFASLAAAVVLAVAVPAAVQSADPAMTAVLAEKKHVTRDLGGTSGTKGFAEAIIAKL